MIKSKCSSAAHDDDGKLGPHKRCQDLGNLSWRQPAARHPAQQSGLPAGSRQELQEQAQSAEITQLVCPNCKGKGPAIYIRLCVCRLYVYTFTEVLVYSTASVST